VALCQARSSTKPLWGFSSSNPYHSQSRAEQILNILLYVMCECGAVVEWKPGDLRNTVPAPPVLVPFLTDDAGLT
jgi:hypothetical protein